MRGVVRTIAQVGSIVPQEARPNAHARRNEVPEIPLTQQDFAAVELPQMTAKWRARYPRRSITAHGYIRSLEVGAH